jgi:hypothetical protein
MQLPNQPRCGSLGRGFTYLWLLFIVAAGATGLAALGQRATATMQREREAELIFRGQQIQNAISTYWQRSPGATKELPRTLAELLEDRRGPAVLRHLRQLYADPFTGQPDWVLLVTEEGRIQGVQSRSQREAMRTTEFQTSRPGKPARVSDRQFAVAVEPAAPAKDVPRNRQASRPEGFGVTAPQRSVNDDPPP